MKPQYNHKDFEEKIYLQWEKSGVFTPPSAEEVNPEGARTFSIIMPPPNANDPLHVGHAMFVAIEDILIRYHRMKGETTLWLPGTDHAGIETQYVFEKKLKKEGKSRFSYDRETLFKMIWDYVQTNSQVAISQMKQLGASADWSRTKFTLEARVVDFVLRTFEKMHADGMVYRDLKLVNYCPRCGTSFSDLEVIHKEQIDPLYYIKYGPFDLATVRPETKFGDTAVAVNPRDTRYLDWIGQEIEVQGLLGHFKLKVIADDYVNPEFGTGVVKITPAHDPNDFEVGKRHGLEIKQIIDFEGKLMAATGPYTGLKVLDARKIVAADLQKHGLITKVDTRYSHTVATCYRCGSTIEPLPSSQFFLRVGDLALKALEALDQKKTVIHGAGREKILRHWLTNLKDWNISRQIVWGIRMPIWYEIPENTSDQLHAKMTQKGSSAGSQKINSDIVVGFLNRHNEFVKGKVADLLEAYGLREIESGLQTLMAPPGATYRVSRTKPGDNYLQETDTFDTWFSSSQWPVVTLKTGLDDDFKRFYPTTVMETGYDILPIWVMRMMLMGIYLTGKTPFEQVYLHGLVRDENGEKMSKSKGNVVNPLDLVHLYGADALRMALVMSTSVGQDSGLGERKVRGMRNLANKIWNAGRLLQQARNDDRFVVSAPGDGAFEAKLNEIIRQTTREIDRLKIGQAAETVHNAFWHWYCDEALEQGKRGELSLKVLEQGFGIFLKLLHPFMPFVTEVVWQELSYDTTLLIASNWPVEAERSNANSTHESTT